MPERRNGRRHRVTTLLVAGCAMFAAAGCTSSVSPASAPVSYAIYPSIPGQPAPTQNAAEISARQAATLEEDLPCTVGKATQTIHVLDTVSSYTVDVTARLATHTSTYGVGAASPANGEYEVATIQIRVRKGSFDYDASNFQFLNPKGQLFDPTKDGAAAGYGPALGTGTLQAGQVANGTVTFDVPPGGGGLLITLPGFFHGSCYWAIGT